MSGKLSIGSVALSGILLFGCSLKKKEAKEKPNFIFVAVDDLNVYNSVLGSQPMNFLHKIYPDAEVRQKVLDKLTPNMDRLSKKAMTFDNAFCASPLCGPSRTALLTGIPAHVSGYYHHDQHFRGYKTLTNVVTLPQYLKRNGYYTAGVGKVYHKGTTYLDRGYYSDWPDQVYSWNHWVEAYIGTGPAYGTNQKYKEEISKYWEQGKRSPKDFTRFGVTTLPREYSSDFRNASFIADLITKGQSETTDIYGLNQQIKLDRDKPWFLACGLFAPHLPWVAPKEFFDMFPQDEMQIDRQLLEWVKNDLKDLSPTGKSKTRNTSFTDLIEYGLKLDGDGGDLNAWKAAFQAYLATVAFSDRNIGILVDAMENNPEHDNTVFVLWSDHGYHVGDKMREGKTTMWEASNHCNLMVYYPKLHETTKGKHVQATVSLQDIYPTIVELAGLERPDHVYGYSLSSILKDADFEWTHPVLNTYEEGNHALRTNEYRYIRFKNGDQELYNLVNDPFEYTNLAGSDDFKDVIELMDGELNKVLEMKPEDY